MKRQLKALFRLLSLVVILSAITPHAMLVYNYTWVPQSDETTLARGTDHPLSFPIFTGNFQISEETVQTGAPGELIQVYLTINYPYPIYLYTPGWHGGPPPAPSQQVFQNPPAPPAGPMLFTFQVAYGASLQCDPITGALATFNGFTHQYYDESINYWMLLSPPLGYTYIGADGGENYFFIWPDTLSSLTLVAGRTWSDHYYEFEQTWTEYGAWEVERRDIPDSGSTAALLGLGVAALIWLRRSVFAQHKSPHSAYSGTSNSVP
jgi:hypothetical protein